MRSGRVRATVPVIGLRTAPVDCSPSDGKVRSAVPVTPWELLALAPALKRGSHGQRRRVEALRTTELEVRTRRPHPINLDGEIGGRTPARFRVLPGALEVFVPAGAA